MAKHSHGILELARKGAAYRYQELKAEIAALLKTFPHLRYGSAVSPAMPDGIEDGTVRRRKRSKMSAAQRKAVSARMKKYWAARRAAKK